MSSVVALALAASLCGALGCSSRSDSTSANDREPAGDTITIYLDRGSGSSTETKVDVQFFENMDPRPHVTPIATLLAKADTACISGVPATVVLNITQHKVKATPRGTVGACLATSLDGKAIDDGGELAVALHVSTVARRAKAEGSAAPK